MRLVATNVGRSLIFLLSTGSSTESLDTTGVTEPRLKKTLCPRW